MTKFYGKKKTRANERGQEEHQSCTAANTLQQYSFENILNSTYEVECIINAVISIQKFCPMH